MAVPLGLVNAESPDLVLATEEAVAAWAATEEDYLSAVDELASREDGVAIVRRGGHSYLLWYIDDPGTTDVFAIDGGCLLVRTWPDTDEEQHLVDSAARAERAADPPLLTLQVPSEQWVLLWAALNGTDIAEARAEASGPALDAAGMGQTALVLQFPVGAAAVSVGRFEDDPRGIAIYLKLNWSPA